MDDNEKLREANLLEKDIRTQPSVEFVQEINFEEAKRRFPGPWAAKDGLMMLRLTEECDAWSAANKLPGAFVPYTLSPTPSLVDALRIALDVHGRQVDKSGEPYLFHIFRVVMAVDGDEARIVAALHDTIEDTQGDQQALYTLILGVFGPRIAEAVAALTRQSGEDYSEYIRRVCGCELARKVKREDLKSNLQADRLARLHPAERERLIAKYLPAWKMVMEVEDGSS